MRWLALLLASASGALPPQASRLFQPFAQTAQSVSSVCVGFADEQRAAAPNKASRRFRSAAKMRSGA